MFRRNVSVKYILNIIFSFRRHFYTSLCISIQICMQRKKRLSSLALRREPPGACVPRGPETALVGASSQDYSRFLYIYIYIYQNTEERRARTLIEIYIYIYRNIKKHTLLFHFYYKTQSKNTFMYKVNS